MGRKLCEMDPRAPQDRGATEDGGAGRGVLHIWGGREKEVLPSGSNS